MNSREFVPSKPHQDMSVPIKQNSDFEDHKNENNSYSNPSDFDPSYAQNFMAMQPPGGMYYNSYMPPYMPFVI
jgi:hypothetical protein